jgi:Rrf2 family nitric oxide-sensitive transcriptional repressor
MRLTVYSDYSLRLLMYLAVKQAGTATIPEVAEAYGISRNHLMKVVHNLAQAGYLATSRGRSGGMRLGKPPSAIGLGDLVRFTEPDMVIVPCFERDNHDCPLWRACRLKRALSRATEAFLAVLDEYTLEDLTAGPEPIRALLGLSGEGAQPDGAATGG